MISKLAKVLLVFTSFSPVFLTYSFVLYLENKSIKTYIIPLVLTVLLILACLGILYLAQSRIQITKFTIDSIKTADGEILSFLIAYLLPFATLTSNELNPKVIGFILVLFFIVILGTNSYHVNPLLTIIGYHFYEVTTDENITYLLITKQSLRNTSNINNVVQLTEYMVLDTRG